MSSLCLFVFASLILVGVDGFQCYECADPDCRGLKPANCKDHEKVCRLISDSRDDKYGCATECYQQGACKTVGRTTLCCCCENLCNDKWIRDHAGKGCGPGNRTTTTPGGKKTTTTSGKPQTGKTTPRKKTDSHKTTTRGGGGNGALNIKCMTLLLVINELA